MPTYKAPLREIHFVMHELLESESFYKRLPGFEDITRDLMNAILKEAARFSEDVLAPLNRQGDEQGCSWDDGEVMTPDGFAEAYDQYVKNGWASLAADREHGGQGMPNLLGTIVNELAGTANWSWLMYPGLSHGAVKTIESHGDPDQQRKFLPKLITGEWTGTMCLTESQCGSDLGLLQTKAKPQKDGSYILSGTKIFISAGEHDMAENIVHIVLARLPDAPSGTKGISLFIVPKYNVDDDGGIGSRNNVLCTSIEKKMGIHGSATCVLNFDEAKGFLIGSENKGLACMFTFINTSRIGTAIQGLAHAELSFQGALSYAKARLAMRSLGGPVNADGPADPIIVHPDIRRMLLTQKALSEGSRAFLYYLSQLGDLVDAGDEESARKANDLMALLTPIGKAFVTESGFEAANLGIQIYGGHGFIREWGMEQIVRDARIAMIYEGTTGIQALDLLGRKVLGSGGKLLVGFTTILESFCDENLNEETATFIDPIKRHKDEWLKISMEIGERAIKDPNEAGAAAYDYLMYSGYIVLGYFWARMAILSQKKIGSSHTSFYEAKLMTAKFYFERILPRTRYHCESISSGAENLMEMPADMFSI
ncbi:MAG: acyl-CoA dehydrogenase C-terminal domain-containing protein [Halieaceae bacterium]|nr:acyl-CoA dehydrogenase C-terminal domain-containing protein [Halieaceae bacterium]